MVYELGVLVNFLDPSRKTWVPGSWCGSQTSFRRGLRAKGSAPFLASSSELLGLEVCQISSRELDSVNR